MFKVVVFLLAVIGLSSAGIFNKPSPVVKDNLQNWPLNQPRQPLVRDTLTNPLVRDTIPNAGERTSGGFAYSDTNKPGLAGERTNAGPTLAGSSGPGLAGGRSNAGPTLAGSGPTLAGAGERTSGGIAYSGPNRSGSSGFGERTNAGPTLAGSSGPGLAGGRTNAGPTLAGSGPTLAGAGERTSGGIAYSNTNKPGLAGRMKREASTNPTTVLVKDAVTEAPVTTLAKDAAVDSVDSMTTTVEPKERTFYMCLIFCSCGCIEQHCCSGCKQCTHEHLSQLFSVGLDEKKESSDVASEATTVASPK